MSINHFDELLKRFESLPLQACTPVLEEASRPTFALVVPELTEGLLEQICRVQALVGREQRLEGLFAFQAEILAVRERRIFLPLDIALVLAAESRIFALAHLVERIAQVTHDVKLVEENRRLRCARCGRLAKRLPPVPHRQANARAFLLAKPVVELRHARLRTVFAAEPDRAHPDQIAHHDTIGVTFPDRDLVDADRLGSRRARFGKLRLHVLLFQRLDRIPVQIQFLGNVLDRSLPAAPAHVMRKALGIEGIVREKLQPLAFHFAATAALHAPHLDLQINARVATGQIANAPRAPVVPPGVNSTATAADRFFERRTRVMTRAFGSPNTPRTVGFGRNPSNAYASHSRRFRFVGLAIQT